MKVILIYLLISLYIKVILYSLRMSNNRADNKDLEISECILSLILGVIATAIILSPVW